MTAHPFLVAMIAESLSFPKLWILLAALHVAAVFICLVITNRETVHRKRANLLIDGLIARIVEKTSDRATGRAKTRD